jgi:hypothetical protein
MYLIQSARCDDPAELKGRPELWRRVRRFNLPVQLAVAAGEEAAAAAEDPARAALISLAPHHSGSPELFDIIRSLDITAGGGDGARLRTPHFNPVVTLHAVDNLALSALAITLGNQAYGLGLGGGAGQGWVALEVAWERLAAGRETEALVVAGDQDAGVDAGLAVALLFARRPAPYPPLGRAVRLVAVNREPAMTIERGEPEAEPHAAAGLAALLTALGKVSTTGQWIYRVPAEHGDGLDCPELVWEVT